MSAYYNLIKKELLKSKQFLGIDLKFFYYCVCFLGVLFIGSFFAFIKNYNVTVDKSQIEGIVYLGLAGGCYLIIRVLNRTIVTSNWINACKLCNTDFIEESALNYLIQEVEQSIKNFKRFVEWSVGVILTLVVLVSTLMLNIYSKLADFIFKGLGEEEIKTFSEEAITQINKQGYDPFSELFGVFFQLLFLFSSFILFGYFVFSSFSIVKRQVLVTLYDIRYAQSIYDEDLDSIE